MKQMAATDIRDSTRPSSRSHGRHASFGHTGRTKALPLQVVALGSAWLLLRFFPPAQYSFYPQCPIYAFTHLLCPGCGATRAVAALLRGHLTEAFHNNALVVVLVPILIGWICVGPEPRQRLTSPSRRPQPDWLVPVSLAIVTLYTVARNLPH